MKHLLLNPEEKFHKVVCCSNAPVAAGTSLAINSIFSKYSQEDEFEADRLGLKYLEKAGYSPNAMKAFLRLLKQETDKDIREYYYFRTHPYLGKRISNVDSQIKGEIEFPEYINLTGDDY